MKLFDTVEFVNTGALGLDGKLGTILYISNSEYIPATLVLMREIIEHKFENSTVAISITKHCLKVLEQDFISKAIQTQFGVE